MAVGLRIESHEQNASLSKMKSADFRNFHQMNKIENFDTSFTSEERVLCDTLDLLLILKERLLDLSILMHAMQISTKGRSRIPRRRGANPPGWRQHLIF